MFLPALLILTAIQVAVQGQTVTPVFVQSNAPFTLTCPADNQATTLTWTGPGGTLYVSGITVDAGLSDSVKPRISAGHTGGSYTLTFTEFLSSDTGIYTCTVDGTVDLQMVVVQGVTSAIPVYTRQGGTVTLQCPATSGSTSWTVTSIVITYTLGTDINPNIPDDTRTRLSVTEQDGNYNLQISDVKLSDVREYKCSSGVTDTFYHLLLYITPGFPEIENTVSVDGQNRTTGTEGTSMPLICNSRGGTPAAKVSWIKYGTNLVMSDNSVQYTKVFTRADDMTVYTCQSSSPALTSPQTTSVLVYLYLKPGKPTILSQTTNLQVVCVSTESRPAAIMHWNVGGTWQSTNPIEVKVKDNSTDTYNVTSTLPVTRLDDGKSVYCRASNQALSGGIESVRHSITVLFPPDIHVRYTNTTYTSTDRVLTCVPDGKPDIYQFGRWRHTSEDGTEIRQLTGSSSPTQSVLILPDPGVTRRYEDTGYYICTAANGIPDSSYYRSGSVFFVVDAPPVISATTKVIIGQIGKNVTVEVEFYSRPVVSSNDVTWTKGSDGIPLSNRSESHVDVKTVQTSFHGVEIQVNGYVAVMSIKTLAKGDLGDYTVTIENRIGKEQHIVTLFGIGPPSTPLYLLQKQITSNSITIQWIPGSDGGRAQTFVISYKSQVTTEYIDVAVITENRESVLSHEIEELTMNTIYYIRIYARNDIGISDQITLNVSTNGNGQSSGGTCSAATALISVSSVLFAAVIVAITVFTVVHKRKLTSCLYSFECSNNPDQHTGQPTESEPQHFDNKDHSHSSRYDDLNLVNVTPASVYETIHDQHQSTHDQHQNVLNTDMYVNTTI